MFKKARFVLNLLQNYKKIGENLQLFREILYFCIKISNIFAFRLLYNQKRALSGVFFLMVYDGSGKRKMEKKINSLKSATIIQYTIKGRFMSR